MLGHLHVLLLYQDKLDFAIYPAPQVSVTFLKTEVGNFYFNNSKAIKLEIFTDSEFKQSNEIIIISHFKIKSENDLDEE